MRDHPANGSGMFYRLPQTMHVLDAARRVVSHGHRTRVRRVRSRRRGRHRAQLRTVVPQLPRPGGACRRSTAWSSGWTRAATAADIGCGAGVAVLTMAAAFPRVDLPRIRHLEACPSPCRAIPVRAGARQREVPRRSCRRDPLGRLARSHHYFRLHPRHDRPRRDDAHDPHPRTRWRLAPRRHQGPGHVRREPPRTRSRG